MPDKQEEHEFEITTTAQVERTYHVKGKDKDTAHKRLRRYLEDPEMTRPDLVVVLDDRTTDTTAQRVKVESIKQVQKPRGVDEPTKDPTPKAAKVPAAAAS